METVFLKVLNMGITASWIILAAMLFRLILKKAPKWISCLLWVLVAFKLLWPFSIESELSLVPGGEPVPDNMITENTFQVNTGIGIVDAPVNEYLGDHYYGGVSVPADNGNHIMLILGTVWTVGVILLILYSFYSYYRLYKMTQVSIGVEENIFLCDAIDTPFIFGVIKPRIYLPSDMERAQMKYVIAHEKAHLRRRDHWWKPFGFLILTVYWFQPLCWFSYILFCKDIELACDERVIREMGQESKRAYAEALLSCSVRRNMVRACPLAFGEAGVKERVKNVLHYKKPAFWIMFAAIICCIIAAVCFLTSPKEEDEPKESEKRTLAEDSEVLNRENGDGGSAGTDSPGNSDREVALIEMLTRWREVYCERDAEAAVDMMTQELVESILIDADGNYSLGYSSPWPWDPETDSYLYDYNEERAEICYFAHTSDPHITCWRQIVEYSRENDRYIITNVETECFDHISTGAEFEAAYHGWIDGTMMDYTKNGLGETLNRNALLSSSMVYRDLFEPESAAAFLLNLSDDPSDIQFTLHEAESNVLTGLDITFLRDQETYTISMFRPYGEDGIWIPVDYRIDVVARFMKVPWDQVKNIRFTEDISDVNNILCIGEIPESNIKVYGYNDEEAGFHGVAVEIGEDVNYFDWFYTSPQLILPNLYWDEAHRQLQISCHVYTGTGASADELHVLQQYDTGTLQESCFDLNGYRELLEERISYRFDQETRELVLTDTETKEELAAVRVPEDAEENVTGLELGMISAFELGEKMYLRVSPGYHMDDMIGIAEYEEMPELRFEVIMTSGENGEIAFELGGII